MEYIDTLKLDNDILIRRYWNYQPSKEHYDKFGGKREIVEIKINNKMEKENSQFKDLINPINFENDKEVVKEMCGTDSKPTVTKPLTYKYCWMHEVEGLEKPVRTFSNPWSEEDHREFIDDVIMDAAEIQGYKLLKFVFLNDEEFEFKMGMELVNHISVKPVVIKEEDVKPESLNESRNLAIALTEFVKNGHSQEECMGFIEGFKRANQC